MVEFIPQVPRTNTLRDRAIAAIIDRLRLRPFNWIYNVTLKDWCQTAFHIDTLSAEEIQYIEQKSGVVILDINKKYNFDEDMKKGD